MNGGSKPWKSVNYIESHDDFAFIDRIFSFSDNETKAFGKSDQEESLGSFQFCFSRNSMLSAGQDFMRNKKGHRTPIKMGN